MTHGSKSRSKRQLYVCIYWLIRCFLVLTSFYLAFISTIYGISNIITIEAVNFFCDLHSAKEVYDHNFNEDANGGIEDSCWTINRLTLNNDAVEQLNLDLFDAKIDISNQQLSNIILFLLFLMLAFVLIIISIRSLYYLIYDLVYYYCLVNKPNARISNIHKKWFLIRKKQQRARKQQLKEQTRTKQPHSSDSKKDPKQIISYHHHGNTFLGSVRYCICDVFWVWCLEIRYKHMYFDSKYKILMLVIGEIVEIMIQFCGLLLYGGIDVFNDNNTSLAQEPSVIISFAIIISANAVFVGVAWFLYVVWHDTWHGTLFFGTIFFIDTFFEIIYTIFPLIYVTDVETTSIFDTRSLGLLTQDNPFIISQVLCVSIFLTSKCWYLKNQLDPAYVENYYYQNINRIKKGTYTAPEPWIITKAWTSYQNQQNIKREHRQRSRLMSESGTASVTQSSLYSYNYNMNDNNINHTVTPIMPFLDAFHVMIRGQFDPRSHDQNGRGQQREQQEQTQQAKLSIQLSSTSTHSPTILPAAAPSLLTVESFSIAKHDNGMVGDIAIIDHDDNGNNNSKTRQDKYNWKLFRISNEQLFRKLIVLLVALIFVVSGLVICICFVNDIEQNFQSKCIDVNNGNFSDNNAWHEEHQEIKVIYDKYCAKKVVNIFSPEYPCNCRQLKIDEENNDVNGSYIDKDVLIPLLKQVFQRWTMLEAFFISFIDEPDEQSPVLDLTENEVKLTHLRIFNTNKLRVGLIDDSINKYMQKLGMFRIFRFNPCMRRYLFCCVTGQYIRYVFVF